MHPSKQTTTEINRVDQVVRNIMIVDDSRLQRKILSSSLRRWGFHVTEAESGQEALKLCKKKHLI